MLTMVREGLMLAVLLAGSARAIVADAGPIALLGRASGVSTGAVARIEEGVITVTPAGAPGPAPRPLDAVAALLPADWWTAVDEPTQARRRTELSTAACAAERAGLGVLELVTGERLIGTLEIGTGDPVADEVTFSHRLMGTRTFALDTVRRIKPEGPATSAIFPPGKDAVALANGDVLSGFIERVGAEVWIKPEGVSEVVRIPIGKVREVRVANPRTAPKGSLIWLDDGSILACDPSSIRAGTSGAAGALAVRAVPIADPEGGLRILGSLKAILAGGGRATPLAMIEPRAFAPAPGRLLSRPPRVVTDGDAPGGVTDIELPGPMSVEWPLPEGNSTGSGTRLLGWLTLAEGAHEWGDCTVTLSTESGPPLASPRLNGDAPVFPLDVLIPAGAKTLRVTVDAGARGAVQDRVLLRRLVLVRE
ncbi:MAG: hypothetical protein ACT4PL_09915 [Phycisphaerales bacterium]